MAKKRRKVQPSKQQQNMMLIAAVAIAVVFIGAIVFLLVGSESDDGSSSTPSDTLALVGSVEASPETIVAEPNALISPREYQASFVDDDLQHVLIDVRTPEEYDSGFIDGAGNINVDVLNQNLDLIPRDVPVVVYCRSGNRSAQATQILIQNGFTEVYDLGGVLDWEASGFTLIR